MDCTFGNKESKVRVKLPHAAHGLGLDSTFHKEKWDGEEINS